MEKAAIPPPKVKICCIKSVEEAALAINAGASVLGLVGHMPSGPGVITNEEIRRILREIPSGVETFLLTSETSSKGIINHYRSAPASSIQIVDSLTEGTYGEIREALPNVKLVQVVHVIDDESVYYARQVEKEVDYILLDSGNPNLAVKELGGTGRTHNWEISRSIVKSVSKPVFLAGGLRASNVRDAFSSVGPYGLDLCSGVRTEDKLDPEKLQSFFRALNYSS